MCYLWRYSIEYIARRSGSWYAIDVNTTMAGPIKCASASVCECVCECECVYLGQVGVGVGVGQRGGAEEGEVVRGDVYSLKSSVCMMLISFSDWVVYLA